MELKVQKRIAASLLKCSPSKIKMDVNINKQFLIIVAAAIFVAVFLFSYQNDIWGIVLSLLLLVIFASLIQTLFHKIRHRMLVSPVPTPVVNIEY